MTTWVQTTSAPECDAPSCKRLKRISYRRMRPASYLQLLDGFREMVYTHHCGRSKCVVIPDPIEMTEEQYDIYARREKRA